MLVAESRCGRRIVGRLVRGVDLLGGLLEICRAHHVRAGEIRGIGVLDSAEVVDFDTERRTARPARVLVGGLQLLGLQGNIAEHEGALSLHLWATLARDRDSGLEILGGRLQAARVHSVEFVIDSWDDLFLRRGTDPTTRLTVLQEVIAAPAGAAPPAPPPAAARPDAPPAAARPDAPPATARPDAPPATARPDAPPDEAAAPASWDRVARAKSPPTASDSPSWESVARASARRAEADAEPEIAEEDMLHPGDILVHPRFGPGEVQRIEGAYEFVHIRLRSGRLIRLSLDVVRIRPSGEEGGKRVFQARIDG